MQTLIAPDGRSTSYAYDAAGRLTRSEQQFDGTDRLITERRYDAADRQTAVAHSRQTGSGTTLIAGQAITRSAGGAVSRIDSFDNTAAFTGNPMRMQLFGYDANARLQSERDVKGAQLGPWLADNQAPVTSAITYGYDAVGNRTSKAVTTPAGSESTAYVYDANDRLTSETLSTATGSTVTTSYAWDANGNLQSKTTPSEYTGYTFDAQNRLVQVRRGASSASATVVTSYGYDGDGQRVKNRQAARHTAALSEPSIANSRRHSSNGRRVLACEPLRDRLPERPSRGAMQDRWPTR